MTTLWQLNVELEAEMRKNGEYDSVMGHFKSLTKSTDKFRYMSGLPDVQKVSSAKKIYQKKDNNHADVMRGKGNAFFTRKKPDYNMSMLAYSASIRYAEPGSKQLSLAFANRSAVAMKMHEYQMCLRDIKYAFENNYPRELHFKILERKAACIAELGDVEYAIKTYTKAENSVAASKLSEQLKAKWVTDVRAAVELLKSKEKKTIPKIQKPRVPNITGNFNEMYPCASDAFSLQYCNKFGRCAIAERDIEIGDVIVVEQPYISVLDTEHVEKNCYFCCRMISFGIPCHQCSFVLFCSEKCRDYAWERYHKVECQYREYLEQLEYARGVVALRTILKAGLPNILAFKNSGYGYSKCESYELYRGHGKDMVYRGDEYHAIYNLLSHEDEVTNVDNFKISILALIVMNILDETGFFDENDKTSSNKSEDRFVVASHLLHMIFVIQGNTISLDDYDSALQVLRELPKEKCNFVSHTAIGDRTCLGAALCGTLLLVNHSCDAAAMVFCYKNVCVLRAIKRIKKGKEITHNYGFSYILEPQEDRQIRCGKLYAFHCMCHACVENWPTHADVDLDNMCQVCPKFVCQKCKNFSFELEKPYGTCKVCKTRYNFDVLLQKTMEAHQEFNVAKATRVENGKMFKKLVSVMRHLNKYVMRPSIHHEVCQGRIILMFSKAACEYSRFNDVSADSAH